MIPIINPYRFAAVAAGLHWIELGRTTLSSTGDTISVGDASANWTSNDSAKTSVNTTNENLDFNLVNDNTNDSIVYDFGSGNISDTQWTLRFKLRFSTLTANSNALGWFGLSDSAQGTSNTSAQDFLGMFIRNDTSTKQFSAQDTNGAGLHITAADANVNWTASTSTDYFFEINRVSATSYNVKRYTDSTYGTVADTASGTSVSGTSGLRYFVIRNYKTTDSGVIQGTLDDLKLWNATNDTSGTPDYNLNFSGLTAKPYLMVLHHTLKSGGTGFEAKMTFNGDSGNNYAVRHSSNGGADSTRLNDPTIYFYRSNNGDPAYFGVGTINNIADQEKIGTLHSVQSGTAGAGNDPSRREHAMKWANTSDQITSVKFSNDDSSSDYAVGSEVVVLGYDPDDTEGGSVWEELASVELGSAQSTIDSGTFTAKKYLWIQFYGNQSSGSSDSLLRFNSDSGSNYGRRFSTNGGTDSTSTSATSISNMAGSEGNRDPFYSNMFIINKSDEEKLVIGELIFAEAGSGAGNAPARREFVAKWANTSSQITKAVLSSNSYDTGSFVKVWGFD